MAQNPALEVGDGHVDARRAEVGNEDASGIRAEGDLPRRTAAGARPDFALDDQPEADELAEPLRHDAAAEPSVLHQLGARTRASVPDLVEHEDEGVEAVLRSAGRWLASRLGRALGRLGVARSGLADPSPRASYTADRRTFAVDRPKYHRAVEDRASR